MIRWIASRIVRQTFAALNDRNLEPAAKAFAANGVLQFPGHHELGGAYHGPAGARDFFTLLFDLFPDLRFHVDDVVVSGPPWNLRLCTRYHDENEGTGHSFQGLQYARLRWGKMVLDQIYNDTQAVAEYLATHPAPNGAR